jgi:ParB/RepB/Spo0J family partition protein
MNTSKRKSVTKQIKTIPIDQIRYLNPRVRNRRNFQEIVQSIARVGLKRPITVSPRKAETDSASYDLVCGQGRIEAFIQLGQTTIPAIVIEAEESDCLVMSLVENCARRQHRAIDLLADITTLRGRGYNDREIAAKIGVIAKAIERNVPRDKIARALDINVRSLARKVRLLDGICQEAIGLLKDKICPMAVFDVLRKMNPMRQIETAEFLINANNFSISYASAILAGTPQAQLVDAQTPKRLKGMTAEAIARMERELTRLREAITSIQDSYGQDHLHLTVVKGHLTKLIGNERVAKYLARYQPEFLGEFQKIVEMTSTLPSEAA